MFHSLVQSRVQIEEAMFRAEAALLPTLASWQVKLLISNEDQARADQLQRAERILLPSRDLHSTRMAIWRAAMVATIAAGRSTESDASQRATKLMALLPPLNTRWLEMTSSELHEAYSCEYRGNAIWRCWYGYGISCAAIVPTGSANTRTTMNKVHTASNERTWCRRLWD